ncbi:MAG: glutamine synthetase, partial [Rhodobacteraceae bacterium]|nr:glutamine synthetase [Paracoccaceae bacterium]
TDTLIAEFGPGQFEINFHHTDDVMFAADMALWFRRLVRGVARMHGLEATFMAKPYADVPGNGMHVHASILDGKGANIFNAGKDLSPRLRAAVGGVLSTMRDCQAIFAPHMNSYRRFQPGSFAPSAPDWGFDNRAAAVRLPETSGPGARLEHRISGADVNPYLAITAILGGMLYGLDNTPDLPLPLDDVDASPAPPLTDNWSQAVEDFSASEFTAEVFGSRYRDLYAQVRRDEIAQLTREISQVEYRTYLGRM